MAQPRMVVAPARALLRRGGSHTRACASALACPRGSWDIRSQEPRQSHSPLLARAFHRGAHAEGEGSFARHHHTCVSRLSLWCGALTARDAAPAPPAVSSQLENGRRLWRARARPWGFTPAPSSDRHPREIQGACQAAPCGGGPSEMARSPTPSECSCPTKCSTSSARATCARRSSTTSSAGARARAGGDGGEHTHTTPRLTTNVRLPPAPPGPTPVRPKLGAEHARGMR